MSQQSASKGKTIGILVGAIVVIAIAAGIGYTQFAGKGDSAAPNAQQAKIEDKMEKASSEIASAAGDGEQEDMAEGDAVVASVNGEEIKRSDVMRFIQNQNMNMMGQQNVDDIFPLALEQVIRGQLVINHAQEANLENDPEVLEQMDGLKKQIVNTVFLQRTVDSKITDNVLKGAYNAHIKQIPDVEERHARHILLDSEEKAKEVIAKLKDGDDFAALAKEYSTGPTGPNGGDLGYFTKEQMVPTFAESAFSMKKGEASSEPVKSEFGYHVIKIEDIRQKPKPTFEEMENYLVVQLRQEILNELIDGWQKQAKIEKFIDENEQLEPAAGDSEQPAEEGN